MARRGFTHGLIEIGERIREKRRERHLSQEALAEKVGVSPITISRIECGQTAMSIEIFCEIIQALGVNAEELLGDKSYGTESKEIDQMVFRIRHLKKSDQEIVLHTVGALIDSLCSHT